MEHLTRAERALVAAYGGDVYLVGGAVRDPLLESLHGIPAVGKDRDLVIIGQTPENVQETLSRIGPFVRAGASFPVFKLTVDGEDYDIALGRKERSTGPGHSDFDVYYGPDVTLADDLTRRDFKATSMARRLADDTLFHLPGAMEDLRDLVLSPCGPTTMAEDPDRILRAAQFAARFGFRLSAETRAQARENLALLDSLPGERIATEMDKAMLRAASPSVFFRTLQDLGALERFLPEVSAGFGVAQRADFHAFDVFGHTMAALDASRPTRLDRYAALLHDIGKPHTIGMGGDGRFFGHDMVGAEMVQGLVSRLRLPTELGAAVESLARHHMYATDARIGDAALRRFARSVGPDLVENLLALRAADTDGCGLPRERERAQDAAFHDRLRNVMMERPVLELGRLAVNGRDVIGILIERGLKPPGYAGDREVGELLASALERVLERPADNDRDVLLAGLHETLDGRIRTAERAQDLALER